MVAMAEEGPRVLRSRRVLGEEVLIVLSLSLLSSAVFSIIDLFRAPISGVSVSTFTADPFADQIASVIFGLAPVALVLHLVRRDGEGLSMFGMDGSRPRSDVAWGLAAGLGVAAVGLGIYLGSVALKINRFVIPVPPLGHWWTVPILLLGALQAALLEEVIVAGYLITRLEQMGLATVGAVVVSAVLRGSYHLYQGFGGFAGNLLLGLAFGWAFARWRRAWPLVVGHFLVDTLAGVGYLIFRGHCVFGACIH
ncbi:MAG TPA: CPBP family intramembrane metalloprotease domain-containing protein [Actinobacteria bacterium]|nr:CPBP family intramembrane metalloprotease domain-containing protein [Actinomycetota bacterium]